MAVGVEKVKDSGYQGLNAFPIPNDGTNRTLTAAAMFSLVVPAYAEKYGVDRRRAQARCWPASRRRTTTTAPATPGPSSAREMGVDADLRHARRWPADLGVFDCAGVADGSAAAIVVPGRGRPPLHRQAALREGAVVRGRQRLGPHRPRLRLHDASPRSSAAASDAYAQAGITDPRRELAMAEVHDCFTPTELVLMEDLGFSERGQAWKDVRGRRRSTSTASCRSTPTAASRASATRSARRACA